MMRLADVNCVCDVYRITRTVPGEHFTTGDRLHVSTSRLFGFKPAGTLSADTTYGDMTQSTWTAECDNDGEVLAVGDIITVKNACYPNDPVRAIEGVSFDVMDVSFDTKTLRCTVKEARAV